MGVLSRLRTFLTIRRARKAGERTGRELADRIETNWAEMKERAHQYRDDPTALRAMFFGWMKQLHGDMRETFAVAEVSEPEFARHWQVAALNFGNRFRSEVLGEAGASHTDTILSDHDIGRLATDIDGAVGDLLHGAEAQREAALEQAVRAIRAAEQEGKLGVDPRSDEELKESIRRMWDEELREVGD